MGAVPHPCFGRRSAKNLPGGPARHWGDRRFAQKIASKGAIAHRFYRPVFWPVGQFFTGHQRLFVALSALVVCVWTIGCDRTPAQPSTRREAFASVRNEPRSYNRHVSRDAATDLVSTLTQARLIRVNKETQELEPWLAESWIADQPGRVYTVKLRAGVEFSDGTPFTADDVLFAFQAAYDRRVASPIGDLLTIGHQPIAVSKVDPHTVTLTFPSPYAPGLRLLDNLPILPRHKLAGPLADGTFVKAWGLSTPPSEIVGLGPFVVKEYVAGQRMIFERNPRYWRRDARGVQLPYLDRLTVDVVPDAGAEQLRLQAGQLDMTAGEVPPESYATVKRAADAGRLKLHDLGVALDADSLWFNLKPGAFRNDPRASWLQRDELRHAISMAVDRRVFADTVFFGAGEPVDGPETPSNRKWYSADVPKVRHDPEGARRLLASIGASGARFTLITQKGRPRLERGAAVIRDELKKIGVVVDVVALDANALIERFAVTKDYEAVYFSPQKTDTDPGTQPDFWLSSGSAHLWNMAQAKPATAWEQHIDDLMAKQIASPDETERRRLYAEVLRTFAEHEPVLYFAAPRLFVAVSSRVSLTPAIAPMPALWSPDTVAVAGR
jgi:peptide/nickel transport system substrate-binding protein